MKPILNIYLSAGKRARLPDAGGILTRILQAAQAADWQVMLRDESDPVDGAGYHLVYNRAVTTPKTLVLRRCYFDPFWRIEATNDRWDWEVAGKSFPDTPTPDAEGFRRRWQAKLLAGQSVSRQGHIFMPLQGKLLAHRHFQAESPIGMIHATRAADPSRKILATLHPRESYTQAELAALQGIDGFEVSTCPSIEVLAACDYVVSENSAMALTGFFAEKPAVLFARIDFHHIAASVPRIGLAAFDPQPKPRFAAYLHWFFKQNAITSWADDAVDQIRARFRDHGWPM
jgi:hypothetical protein